MSSWEEQWKQHTDAQADLTLELQQSGALPRPSPAERFDVAMRLLAPTIVETCPHCGAERERTGEPMISLEDALKLLEG